MTHELGYGVHEVASESFDEAMALVQYYIEDLIEEKEPEIKKMIEDEDY
jgi:hypothetical protein